MDSRPLPSLLPPIHGPWYGSVLPLRYVSGYGAPPANSGSVEKRRSMPYFTCEHVTGSPPSHRMFGLSVKSQIVLSGDGRPVSVARSGTISLAAGPGSERYAVS